MIEKVTKNKQNKSGISLIVLVITIVVIIILAAAVIVSFTANNPINAANEAKFKSDISAFRSELLMYKSSKLVDNLGSYNPKLLNADKTKLEEQGTTIADKTILDVIPLMKNTRYVEILQVVEGELAYTGTDDKEKKWFENSGVIIDKPEVPATEEYASKNRTIDGNAPSYSNPIIPKGFRAVNIGADANKESIEQISTTPITKAPGAESTGYASSWKNVSTDYDRGLVIEDSTENQFVWVPASKYGYQMHYNKLHNIVDIISDDINEQTQIDTYGGFWIGRFEASDNAGNAASIQNKRAWVNISYNNCKSKAEAFASSYGHSKTYFESSLLTGKMWDTTCKFIASDGTDVDTDSTSWGNYKNVNVTANDGSILKAKGAVVYLNTGVTKYTNKKNIYDLAGNNFEWVNSMKVDTSSLCGGNAANNADAPASCSIPNSHNSTNTAYGFRLALYIK